MAVIAALCAGIWLGLEFALMAGEDDLRHADAIDAASAPKIVDELEGASS